MYGSYCAGSLNLFAYRTVTSRGVKLLFELTQSVEFFFYSMEFFRYIFRFRGPWDGGGTGFFRSFIIPALVVEYTVSFLKLGKLFLDSFPLFLEYCKTLVDGFIALHAGQSVEDRAFAYIGVSGKGNNLVAWCLLLNDQSGINRFDSNGTVRKTHSDTSKLHCVNQDIPAIFRSNCDHSSPDQKSRGVTAWTSAQTLHIRIFNQPNIQQAAPHAAGPYNYQNFEIDGWAYYTNNPPAGAFRGFGVTQTCFCVESLLNQMADRVGITPWEIRWRNAIRPGQELPNGQIVDASTGLAETLEAVKPYYDAAKYVGIGCAMTIRDIKQNLFWAFCYNTVGIPVAAGALFLSYGLLLSPMESDPLPFHTEMVEELIRRGHTPERIAVTLMGLSYLHDTHALKDLSVPTASGKKAKVQEYRPMAAFVIDIGSSSRVTDRHIIGAVTERAGISSRDMGKVQISESFSTVGVPADVLADVMLAMRGCKICGKPIHVMPVPEQQHRKKVVHCAAAKPLEKRKAHSFAKKPRKHG